MPSSYKTPGVYVEEVTKFPPSVAPVATAIPAFIGYTKKAEKNGESLLNKPTKIGSFVEFEQYFGGAPTQSVIIFLDSANQFNSAASQGDTYLLYHCLRHFYDNGGGDCYIVSVGNYEDSVNLGSDTGTLSGIAGGVKALEKYDEPTMIVSPDAVLLSGNDMYSYQQKALAQCAKLQDRVLIGDLLKNDENTAGATFDERVTQFRDHIGINNLKYGAVYAPWVRTSLLAGLTYRDVLFGRAGTPVVNITPGSSRGLLFGLTSDKGTRQLIYDLENAIGTVNSFNDRLDSSDPNTIVDSSNNLDDTLKTLIDAYDAAITAYDEGADDWNDAALNASLTALYDQLVVIANAVQTIYDALPAQVATVDPPSASQTAEFKLANDIENLADSVKAIFDSLATHHVEIASGAQSGGTVNLFNTGTTFDNAAALFGYTPAPIVPADVDQDADVQAAYAAIAGPGPIQQAYQLAGNAARGAATTLSNLYSDVIAAAKDYETTFNNSLKDAFGFFKSMLNRAEQSIMVLPPSAAMAGIYTFVDNTRGVWKAPANVSLSSVTGPYVVISADEQADLNVDANAGKSINVIRSFTGKGTLVWGARTLAGNDNEWRYISVRRFFNFAEESIKKATEQFVFEPNDANTWVRVKAMIENFLILQWRAGALAGAKPEQAFFVKVGLGQTMTSLDILEGRMIVEIGMAVVRPAEFIILRFSHKMQEA